MMSSSNPFRKSTAKPPAAQDSFAFDTSSIPRAAQPPPPVSFRHSSSASPASPEPEAPAETQTKKKKVVKKVRVLSPPPLSPDSPEWPNNKPWEQPQQQGAVGSEEDPFGGSDSTPGDSGRGTPQLGNYDAWNSQGGAPGMFKGQMEADMKAKEGEALKIGNGNGNANGKGMDVSAFQRLLMTGNKGDSSLDGAQDQNQPPPATAQKAEEEAEAGDDLSDSSMTVQFGQRKKAPPPPPSSRHGKSINTTEPSEESSQPQTKTSTATDASKRSAPAPPPRRGHSRTESKAIAKDEPPSPTRPNTNRNSTYAPAPPPPRRPHAAGRSQTSPTTTSFPQDTSTSAPATQEVSSDIDPPVPKISAPPPPPARNTSVRRPPSVSSVEAPSRQVSSDSTGRKPPPPPARKRGSSKGSMDVPRTMGADGVVEEGLEQGQQGQQGQGQAILSDLEALQREVDALRGKMG